MLGIENFFRVLEVKQLQKKSACNASAHILCHNVELVSAYSNSSSTLSTLILVFLRVLMLPCALYLVAAESRRSASEAPSLSFRRIN